MIATAIKGVFNHHMVVYIHNSDCYDGKRLPLLQHTTFKIMLEGFLKTIFIYGTILIVLHMDRLTVWTYLGVFVFDIFDNHYASVKKYLRKESNRSEVFLVRRVTTSQTPQNSTENKKIENYCSCYLLQKSLTSKQESAGNVHGTFGFFPKISVFSKVSRTSPLFNHKMKHVVETFWLKNNFISHFQKFSHQ